MCARPSSDDYPGRDLPLLIQLQPLAQDPSTFSHSLTGFSQTLNQSRQSYRQTLLSPPGFPSYGPSLDFWPPGQPVSFPRPLQGPSFCGGGGFSSVHQTGPSSPSPVEAVQGFGFSTNSPSLASPNSRFNQLPLDQDPGPAATGPSPSLGLTAPNSAAANLSGGGDFFDHLGLPTNTQFTTGQQHNQDASLLRPADLNPSPSSAYLSALLQPPQDTAPNEALYQDLATRQLPSSFSNALSPSNDPQPQLQPSAGSFLPPRPQPAPQGCVSAFQTADVDRDLEAQWPHPSFSFVSHPHGCLPQENDDRGVKNEDEEDGVSNNVIGLLVDDNMPASSSSRKRARATASIDEQAGPSIVKRRRSRSSTAASAPSTKAAVRKPTKDTGAVVIPDSDDFFEPGDGEEPAKLFDLTRDDKIPEELMPPPKADDSIKLAMFECIICMDSAMNLTVTHCGHMFCGNCLHQAIHAEPTKKICPMCRQKLDTRPKNGQSSSSKNAKTFFHLELKLRPSKKQGKQPARVRSL